MKLVDRFIDSTYFKLINFVDFCSPSLGASFWLNINFNEGLSSAFNSVLIQPKPWNTHDLAIIRKVTFFIRDGNPNPGSGIRRFL